MLFGHPPGWGSLTRLYSRLAGAVVISRLDEGGFTSKFTHMAVGRLLARDISSLPHRPLHRAAHNIAAESLQSERV